MSENIKRDSTARSRELGAELRKRRQAARLQGVDLARKLGWSQAKVSRMETGDRTTSELDLAVYLTFCGVHGDELAELLDLAKDSGDEVPMKLRTLAYHEKTASTIECFEPLLIPGLLQTEDYARALFEWVGLVPADRVESPVKARLERQGLLDQWNPPKVTFYVHEYALHTLVGGARTMHEQMLNLLFATSRPQIDLRIIPVSAGPHGGMSGAFVLMQYDQHRPVLYRESLVNSTLLERRQDIDAYKTVLSRLAEIALDGGESREEVARLANEYEQPIPEPQ